MSILTFNLSVADKKNITSINEPFQIMPSTRNILSDKTISAYPKCSNDKIIIHMNYITRVFKKDALENDSSERYSLRQHVKLANKLGTKNILIHMPSNENELSNLGVGFKVMYDELVAKGLIVHLEIASWSKSLMNTLEIQKSDPKEYVTNFITKVVGYMNAFPPNAFYIVMDTAHLFANGCEVDDTIYIMNKFKDRCKYMHLNGNVNGKFTTDSHTPMFASNNKIKDWDKLYKFCASLNIVCIAEVTKYGAKWDEWEKYARDNRFVLVKHNEDYSY